MHCIKNTTEAVTGSLFQGMVHLIFLMAQSQVCLLPLADGAPLQGLLSHNLPVVLLYKNAFAPTPENMVLN